MLYSIASIEPISNILLCSSNFRNWANVDDGECDDIPDWVDVDGMTCNDYASKGWCVEPSHYDLAVNGVSAHEACGTSCPELCDVCQVAGCSFGCLESDGSCDSHSSEVEDIEWDDVSHANGAVLTWCANGRISLALPERC